MLELTAATQPPQLDNIPQQPNAHPYVSELMLADGKVSLAASRLNITPAQLISEIARDPDAQRIIDAYLRLYGTIKAFQMLGEAQLVLQKNLPSLEPFESAKHFTTLLGGIESLTRRSQTSITNNTTIYEAAIKRLPPEVQQALQALATPTTISDDEYAQQIIDHKPIHDDDAE